MVFLGLDKKNIQDSSELQGDGLYRYQLGEKVEVFTRSKSHVNDILSKNLSSDSAEDKFMIRYTPINEVFFTKEFLEDSGDMGKNFASCMVSDKVCIGETNRYPTNNGVLAFTGVLSINSIVERDRGIKCSSQIESILVNKVKVLACGVRHDTLFGLFYIPSERGISVEEDNGVYISAKNLGVDNHKDWHKFTLDTWFQGASVREKGETT